jgi:hypothetical protein
MAGARLYSSEVCCSEACRSAAYQELPSRDSHFCASESLPTDSKITNAAVKNRTAESQKSLININ